VVGDVKYLVDTNIWLEVFLGQERADEARGFLEGTDADLLAISEFSLYSLGIILTRLKKNEVFLDFLSDLLEGQTTVVRLEPLDLKPVVAFCQQFQLDFDDGYQYEVAEKYDLTIVSFDKGFERTTRGRRTPGEVIVKIE
jgi:uncharacterized protein